MTYTLDDLNRADARQERAGSFVVASLLTDELRIFADDPLQLADFARTRGITKGVMSLATKAVVSPGATTDAVWAGPLAASSPDARAFLSVAERQAVLPRLGAIQVTGMVTAALQVGNAEASWIGEDGTKPIRSMSFNATNLKPLTLTSNVVMTEELSRFSIPGAQGVVERALSVSMVAALDTALLDPASGAIAGVRPASLLSGVTPLTPTGDFSAQIGQVMAAISGDAPSRPVLVVGPAAAVRLSGLRDLAEAGIRVLVSPAAGARLIAIDADAVIYTDDGIELRRGRPDLQLSDTPDTTWTAATILASAWQRNLTAIKCLRHVVWAKRSDAVAFLVLA